jgi:hypothetical protein
MMTALVFRLFPISESRIGKLVEQEKEGITLRLVPAQAQFVDDDSACQRLHIVTIPRAIPAPTNCP